MPRTKRRTLLIDGIQVDRALLERRKIERCDPQQCGAYCCGGGVAIGVEQARDILAHAAVIRNQLPPSRRRARAWFNWASEPEKDHPSGGERISTAVVENPSHPTGSSCVFLRSDLKCALQVASLRAGEHPWRFKPLYCALHPITFQDHVLKLGEENEMYIDGGRCTRDVTIPIAVFQLLSEEIRWVLGDKGYRKLKGLAKRR